MNYKLIPLFLLCSCIASAQNESRLLQQYTDSLHNVRDSLASLPVGTPSLPVLNGTWLHSVFSLEAADSPSSADLLRFLIRQPGYALPSMADQPDATPLNAIATPRESDGGFSLPSAPVQTILPEMPAPETVKPRFWTYGGDFYLQFLQNFVSSNWYKGGESNYSLVSAVTLTANYNNRQRVKWDNMLELKLGYTTSRTDEIHHVKTSEDLIRLTSKLGLQARKDWYYTLQFLASTQFTKGYKNNDPMIYSDFLSPLKLNLSLGMDYTVHAFKDRLQGSIHLAPIALNFIYVERAPLAERYGLDADKHTLFDIGSQTTIALTWKPTDNIQWQTRLYAYTTYRRTEMEWENTISLRFNRYITANLFLYPRFDDNAARTDGHSYWQLKEYTSLGFALTL